MIMILLTGANGKDSGGYPTFIEGKKFMGI